MRSQPIAQTIGASILFPTLCLVKHVNYGKSSSSMGTRTCVGVRFVRRVVEQPAVIPNGGGNTSGSPKSCAGLPMVVRRLAVLQSVVEGPNSSVWRVPLTLA